MIDENLWSELHAVMASDGMLFGLNVLEVDKELKRLIGPDRFRKFCRTMDGIREGLIDHSAAYEIDVNVRVAMCHMSAQSLLALTSNAAVVQMSGVLQLKSGRVADFGCHAGSTLRYLAQQLPEVQFVGFDRLGKLLKDASARSPKNVEYVEWDYAKTDLTMVEPFDLMLGAFPFAMDNILEFDPFESEEAGQRPETLAALQEAYLPASSWRALARTGTRLSVCMRLVNLYTHAIWLCGFAQSGWSPMKDTSRWLQCDGERFVLQNFEAVEPFGLDYEDLLETIKCTNKNSAWSSLSIPPSK